MILGVTGGIGSGKSYVCGVFSLLGAMLYDSDYHAKRLMTESEELISRIKQLFGEEAYSKDGVLNRQHLSDKVFSDGALLSALNSVVHPAVASDFLLFAERNNSSTIVLESAILIESGFDKFVDRVVVVTADIESRISRVMGRDGVSADSIRARISAQISDEAREGASDYIINNNDFDLVLPQVLEVM